MEPRGRITHLHVMSKNQLSIQQDVMIEDPSMKRKRVAEKRKDVRDKIEKITPSMTSKLVGEPPKEDQEDETDDDGKDKKKKRLVRNREAAQASRERKKMFVGTLQEEVAELKNKVKQLEGNITFLENENAVLKHKLKM